MKIISKSGLLYSLNFFDNEGHNKKEENVGKTIERFFKNCKTIKRIGPKNRDTEIVK